jgi:3-carboxy-cis,cis-muconate cycloisomerase
MSDTGLFDGVLARGAVRDAVDDHACLVAMLEVEAALARAEARVGIIPTAAADAITAACRPGAFDIDAIGQAAASSGNPAIPLVAALTAALDSSSSVHVHAGATSQDIVDTALMLVTRAALDLILVDIDDAADAAASLAEEHRATLVSGRTLLQQALPTTFGMKAAGWLAGLDAAATGLDTVRRTRLAVQLGGAAGTLAVLGDDGPAVVAALAAELGLGEPTSPWHTERTRIADLAGALGTAGAAIGKPALDIVLLAQTEVGEVHEGTPGRGGSSTLPQKHNPIAAISARACAAQAPGLVATLLAAAVGEHERAAGAWHAEWRPMLELLRSVGSAAAWLRDSLEHLVVDQARMRENLDRSGGVILAERIASALTPSLGREAAAAILEEASRAVVASGRSLSDVLSGRPDVARILDRAALDHLIEPRGYLGSVDVFLDGALAAHHMRRGVRPGRAR